MAKPYGFRIPPTVEKFLFVELTMQDAMALYSRWMASLDKNHERKSFYTQLEKTHRIPKRKENDEGIVTEYTQYYSLIVIISRKHLTKKELINCIKKLQDTPTMYESSRGKNR